MRNPIDSIVEFFSPGRAVERAYARFTLAETRSYEAAKSGRRTEGWRAPGTSANAEVGPAAFRVRNRIRSLVRDNPYAAQAIRKLSAKTVGAGIVPRLKATREEVERKSRAASLWQSFSDNCDPEGILDFYGMQDLTMRTVYEAGEALIRFIPRPSSWKLPVPLQLQVLEPDFLDSAKNEPTKDGGAIIQGVEYDAEGRRVAYWMFDEHPGETLVTFTRRAYASRRVPAAEIRHVFRPYRPGQARGISLFTPSVMRLRDTDDYADAELLRKKIAACFVAFVKKSGGPAASTLAGAKGTTTDKDDRRLERMAPGQFHYGAPGDEVEFGSPPESTGYVEFMRHELHAVAAGIGITYEQMTGDLSQVNYSSIRAGLIDFWDVLDQWQWFCTIPLMCRPTWSRVGRLLVATGQWDAKTPFEAIWAPPRRRWVDPSKEIGAMRDEVRGGFASLPSKIAETGEDPDEVLAEIADTNKYLDAEGIVLDTDPRHIARGGSAQQILDAPPAGAGEPDLNKE